MHGVIFIPSHTVSAPWDLNTLPYPRHFQILADADGDGDGFLTEKEWHSVELWFQYKAHGFQHSSLPTELAPGTASPVSDNQANSNSAQSSSVGTWIEQDHGGEAPRSGSGGCSSRAPVREAGGGERHQEDMEEAMAEEMEASRPRFDRCERTCVNGVL